MAIKRYGIVDAPGRPRMSLGLAAEDWVTVCAVPPDCTGGIADQTQQVLTLLERYLVEMGSSKQSALAAIVWLKDMADYDAMNRVWNAWVNPVAPPARSCMQASMARPAIRVEIRVTAARTLDPNAR